MNPNDPPGNALSYPATGSSPPVPAPAAPTAPAVPAAPTASAIAKLTPRQRAVLALLLTGQSNKLIGRQLGLTANTTKDHVAATLKRLGLRKRGDALRHAQQLMALLTNEDSSATPGAAAHDPAPTPPAPTPAHDGKLPEFGLTGRQLAVLVRLIDGLPNKQIAEQMGLSIYTVKEYVSEILKRLGVKTRFEVISLVQRMDKTQP
ncbi:LuxR C-terminal-related transcriptional regulator [Cupriavidus sp. USMAHM13]|uniref:LuxR C-terminal-related transcriptional regulator n=1 Tax=Cupriavidus sp. USMAHM13 TaxID=1389192 RepID=UPI0009F280E5|nr:LuxR C-terminal-related transcriptional regulator [Cupriavidus sp. USMAHM13]